LSTLFSSLIPPSAPKQITEQALHYNHTNPTVNRTFAAAIHLLFRYKL
jgi:hypothetical protein